MLNVLKEPLELCSSNYCAKKLRAVDFVRVIRDNGAHLFCVLPFSLVSVTAVCLCLSPLPR